MLLHINSNYMVSKLHENLIDQLHSFGYNQIVFMPIKKELLKEFVFDSNYEIHHPISFSNIDKYIFTWKQYKIMKKLKQTIDISGVSLIHAHTLFTDGNIAYSLYKERGIPYVVTIREFTDMDFFKKRPNLRRKGKEIVKNAKYIVFLTTKSKEAFLSTFFKSIKTDIDHKIKVIPNGIDQYWFQNEFKPHKLALQNNIQFIYAGRIMKSKNIPLIISALEKLNKETQWKPNLTIIGNVKDKSEMKYIYKETSFPLTYIDKLPREELLKEFRKHDIFIMPSIRESFGLVYAEALSQGLPIIYSKTSGFYKQFEEGKVGYGVNPFSLEETYNTIVKTIENYNRISNNTLEAYKRYNWKAISEHYNSMYKSIGLDSKK